MSGSVSQPVLTAAQFAAAYGLTPGTPAAVPAPTGYLYTTRYNERWDNIAYLLYGDPTQVGVLIQANPGIAIDCQLPQGTLLYVPFIPAPTPPASVTPWQP